MDICQIQGPGCYRSYVARAQLASRGRALSPVLGLIHPRLSTSTHCLILEGKKFANQHRPIFLKLFDRLVEILGSSVSELHQKVLGQVYKLKLLPTRLRQFSTHWKRREKHLPLEKQTERKLHFKMEKYLSLVLMKLDRELLGIYYSLMLGGVINYLSTLLQNCRFDIQEASNLFLIEQFLL